MGSPLYRARQFARGFRNTLTADEAVLVRSTLSERELTLFTAMEPRDRRHSLDLAHRLGAAAGEPLLAAALLHDVGKGRLSVWDRVAFVLLGALGRGVRERFETEHGGRMRQALWRLEHHAALGAVLLAEAGTAPRVIALVAAHTAATGAPGGADPELARLIEADEAT